MNNLKKIYTLLRIYNFNLFAGGKRVFLFRIKNPQVFLSPKSYIHFDFEKQLTIGTNSAINAWTTIIIANDTRNPVAADSSLRIGENTYIGEYNNIRAGGGKIEIGSNCSISQHISIIASNHNIKKGSNIQDQLWSMENNFVIIKDDVWIGANCVILPGVTIEKGAVVGAGSVVTKNIPEYAVVCGNPAKIIKYRS